MKIYFSKTPLWHKPTDAIRALHEQTIVIHEADGTSYAKLRVTDADPKGPDAGLCKVAVWWTALRQPEPPTQTISQLQEYLSEDALRLIRSNPDANRIFQKLLLEIPATGEEQ